METILLVILMVLFAGGFFLALRSIKSLKAEQSPDQNTATLIAGLVQTITAGQVQTNNNLLHLSTTVASSLEAVNKNVQSAIGDSQRTVEATTGQVGQRLDNAARAIAEVQGQLGSLRETAEGLKDLTGSVASLQQLLTAPHLRGGLSESLLEDILAQVLPKDSYELQHKFRSGNAVDALILTAKGNIPVDSKFPFENFRKAIQAKTDQERNQAARAFMGDVKNRIDEIATKYIVLWRGKNVVTREFKSSTLRGLRSCLREYGLEPPKGLQFPIR